MGKQSADPPGHNKSEQSVFLSLALQADTIRSLSDGSLEGNRFTVIAAGTGTIAIPVLIERSFITVLPVQSIFDHEFI